jgi:SAM-dependent methyltransferase
MGSASSRWQRENVARGSDYDRRFEALAAAGHDVHGEASFVMGYGPQSVLDAGCGTGRVAMELARRGVEVVGVDLDRAMLEIAVENAPHIDWYRADLSTLSLRQEDGSRRRFQMVVAAGNVMIFVEPGTESATLDRLAAHLVPGGLLVSGFQLSPHGYGVDRYDVDCANAGLELAERFSTWARDPWTGSGGYAVSVHRRVAAGSER